MKFCMCNDSYLYSLCCKKELWTNCGFWFTGVWTELGVKWTRCEMEPVECRAVIRFLYLKGRTPKETFDEMKETYGDDAPSYDLVKRWHPEFKHGRKFVETAPRPGSSSAIDEASVGGPTWGVLQKRCPELHQTMGEMHNYGWFLWRERLITVPSFINLLLWEMSQSYYLLNAPRTSLTATCFHRHVDGSVVQLFHNVFYHHRWTFMLITYMPC